MRPPLIMQFIAAFNNDKVIFFLNSSITIIVTHTCIYISHFFFQNTIQLPAFYHTQWAPNYPEMVHLRYNGAIYEVRVRQHRDKVYLADGLQSFRKDLKIYKSTSTNFFACDHHSVFDIHFIPPLERQTCSR